MAPRRRASRPAAGVRPTDKVKAAGINQKGLYGVSVAEAIL
jgi:hypothetical protein